MKNKYEAVSFNFFKAVRDVEGTVILAQTYTQAEARKAATAAKKSYLEAHPTVGGWGTATDGYHFTNGHKIRVRPIAKV